MRTRAANIYLFAIVYLVTAAVQGKHQTETEDLTAEGTFFFKKFFKNSLLVNGYPLIGYFPNNFIPYGILFPSNGQFGLGYYY